MADDNKPYLLVLTACIQPSASSQIQRADPALRLQDYITALRYWLTLSDPRISRILFIENSGYPLTALEQLVKDENPHGKQVEFVSLNCNDFAPRLHYGYGELVMLERGLAASTLAASAHYMIKVTGRLTFPALLRLLDAVPENCNAFVDARDSGFLVKRHQRIVTTQLMIFALSFYRRYLSDAYEDMDAANWFIEDVFYYRLRPFFDMPKVIMRWPFEIQPVGVGAHGNVGYNTGKRRLLSMFRMVTRRVLPGWWI